MANVKGWSPASGREAINTYPSLRRRIPSPAAPTPEYPPLSSCTPFHGRMQVVGNTRHTTRQTRATVPDPRKHLWRPKCVEVCTIVQSRWNVPPMVKLPWWRRIRICQSRAQGTPRCYSRRLQSRERWREWPGTQLVGRGRPNVLLALAAAAAAPVRQDRSSHSRSRSQSRISLYLPLSRSTRSQSLSANTGLSCSRHDVAVPFPAHHRRQACTNPAAVVHRCRILDWQDTLGS